MRRPTPPYCDGKRGEKATEGTKASEKLYFQRFRSEKKTCAHFRKIDGGLASKTVRLLDRLEWLVFRRRRGSLSRRVRKRLNVDELRVRKWYGTTD